MVREMKFACSKKTRKIWWNALKASTDAGQLHFLSSYSLFNPAQPGFSTLHSNCSHRAANADWHQSSHSQLPGPMGALWASVSQVNLRHLMLLTNSPFATLLSALPPRIPCFSYFSDSPLPPCWPVTLCLCPRVRLLVNLPSHTSYSLLGK